jgi:hypothetical protein
MRGAVMKTLKKEKIKKEQITWEEESGLIDFLSSVNAEVDLFNGRFGFDIRSMAGVPENIDGNRSLPMRAGFFLERNNPLMPELRYCLYSLLKDRALFGAVGLYRDGSVTTLKELRPMRNFKKGKVILYDWMSQLVRASCEKIML